MRRPFVVLWTSLAAVFLFSWIYLPVLSKYRDLKSQDEKIAQEITGLEEKIKVLLEERDLLKNDVTYLEKVIRDELGLVRPGETVYKFVSDGKPNRQDAPPEAEETARV